MQKNLRNRTLFYIFALIRKRSLPHQSRLGNSSNTNEMPRQAFALMAGPNLYEVFSEPGDYKEVKALKSCHTEFHRIL